MRNPTSTVSEIISQIFSPTCGLERKYLHRVDDYRQYGSQSLSFTGFTPLLFAVWVGRVDVVDELLLKRQANPKVRNTNSGFNALHLAVWLKNYNMVTFLVESGRFDLEERNKNGRTALQIAFEGKEDSTDMSAIFLYLISKGVPPTFLPLVAAKGDPPLFLLLADQVGCDITARLNTSDVDSTALNLAIKYKNVACALLLIARGVPINPSDPKAKTTPLHLACQNMQDVIARALVTNGAILNSVDSQGNTPLYYSTKRLQDETIDFLVSEGCSYCAVPLQETTIGKKRARSPVVNAHPLATELLMTYSSAPAALWEALLDPLNDAQVCMAIVLHPRCGLEIRTTDYDGLMLNESFTVLRGATPLLMAALAGRFDVVSALIDAGADITACVWRRYRIYNNRSGGLTTLHLAVYYDAKLTVEVLLSKGADASAIECNDRTPMFFVQSAEVVNALVAKGALVRTRGGGTTPLHEAVARGSLSAVKALVAHGAHLNHIDSSSKTPLHIAIKESYTEVAKFLISAGADLDFALPDDTSPLHHAVLACNSEIIEALVVGGATVDAKGPDGCTPLHYAIAINGIEAVDYLLSKGASINEPAKLLGYTALHFAAVYGRVGIVELLVTKGADKSATDKMGQTPLQLFDDRLNFLRLAKVPVSANITKNILAKHAEKIRIALS